MSPIGALHARHSTGVWLRLLIVACAIVGGSLLNPSQLAAQPVTPPTPFPRALVAFVPTPAPVPSAPALAIQSIAVAEGTGVGTGGTRRVTVGFTSSFSLPAEPYRVSIVWGTPGGTQTRASLVASKAKASGTIETSGDGKAWKGAGVTDVSFGGNSVAIDAPAGDGPAGVGLWAQAELGTDGARIATTPVFSRDATLGITSAGGLPATGWGSVVDAQGAIGPDPASFAFGGPAPTLTVDNQALIVNDPSPAPTRIDGQAVTSVIDEVTFVSGFTPGGAPNGVVQINRTSGSIRAFTGTAGPPSDRGGGSWIIKGLAAPPDSSTAPMAVTVALQGASDALGVTLDPSGTGLGLRRKVTLADGRMLVGLPVTATVAWFLKAAAPTQAPAGTSPVSGQTRIARGALEGNAPLVATAVVVALVLLVAGLSLLRRGRGLRRGRASRPGPAVEVAPQVAEASLRSPAAILAALDAEVEGLSARVERLGGGAGDGARRDR